MVPHIFLVVVDMDLLEEVIFVHNLCHSIRRMEVVDFAQANALCMLLGYMDVVEVGHVGHSSHQLVDHSVLGLVGSVDDTGEDRVRPGSEAMLDSRKKQQASYSRQKRNAQQRP